MDIFIPLSNQQNITSSSNGDTVQVQFVKNGKREGHIFQARKKKQLICAETVYFNAYPN